MDYLIHWFKETWIEIRPNFTWWLLTTIVAVLLAALRWLRRRVGTAVNGVKIICYHWVKRNKPAVIPSRIARLNQHVSEPATEAVRIHGPYEKEPLIIIMGPLKLTKAQEQYARKERSRIKKENEKGNPLPTNDPHAILADEPNWEDDPVTFRVWTLDYASVLALKQDGKAHSALRRISANALIICREAQQVILHERADDSETYGGRFHTIGGSFRPPWSGADDDHKLSRAVRREVFEESEITINLDEQPPMIILEELSTGFIQLAFLGVNISVRDLHNRRTNPEGKEIPGVSFSQLPNLIGSEGCWVPTGRAAVLAWLALGAPNAGSAPTFGRLSPVELFDLLIPSKGTP